MASSRPIIAVFGATGQQGGAVVRALSASNEFHVRAITRNPQSEAAQKLAKENGHVELVAADLEDEKSLQKAFSDAWGTFIATKFFDPAEAGSGVKEEHVVKRAADEALKAGVKFLVFSSLADAATISGGRNPVAHFTDKNKAEQYIRTLPFADGVAFPYAGSFASNYLTRLRPKKSEKDGVYEFAGLLRYDVAVPIVDIDDEFSATVLDIFRHPKKYNQQSIFTGTYYTLSQLAEAFTKATGKPARYVQIPPAVAKHMPPVLTDMLQYFNDFGYYGGQNVHNNPNKTDAVSFWKKHAHQF